MKKYIVLSFFLLGFSTIMCSQSVSNDQIKDLITSYKNDVRGPYKDIRWFCTDGSLRQPKDPCPENIGPGVQHARYKDAVVNLGKTNHIYLGQILAYTDAAEFWDVKHNHSRLKQYQLDKYLRTIDNGWVNQKGQFYRGSIQSEDEEAWGIEFYKWLLANDTNIKQNYFLIRQSLKDIPHSGDDNVAQLMRSQSKVISDVIPEFMDLRVKIHSLPEASDIQKVKNFKQTNTSKISTVNGKKIDELIATMTLFFKPVDVSALAKQTTALKNTEIGSKINGFISSNSDTSEPSKLIEESSQLLYDIREAVITETSGAKRLQLLDVSLKLEEIVFKTAQDWETETVDELLNKICYLGLATAGAGYVELSEWQELDLGVKPSENKTMTLDELTQVLENARRQVEGSSSMVKANYQIIIPLLSLWLMVLLMIRLEVR